ncbi:MAG: homoserine dehydrogenase [Flavipsychrobacter sp.]|jgi:homoserine dehydrogenase|nr:homoserine dehydrogenase [Flavipsychrobacter sp.]
MSIQNQTKLNIGLFGFGVVGEGLYKVLAHTPTLNAQIKHICIKHQDKHRNAPAELFTTNASELLNDKEINVIIELIDDADAAYRIVTKALRSKKAVVSANKKLIAEHIEELIALQQEYDTPFLYEAACCASIPVIRNLEEYYDNDLLQGLSGIVNGSTNYILTKVFREKKSFDDALLQAQVEGFAESNPALDIEGIDAVNKLSILLVHAYGIISSPQALLHTGIQNLQASDAVFAKEKGYEIKLVAQARKLSDGKVAALVLLQFVKNDSQLYTVNNEYNGVVIESSLADKQFFYGKGAGGFPTASAVLSDLSALRYNYRYEYKKLHYQEPSELSTDFYLKVCISFKGLLLVPHERFDRVLEWSSNEQRCHVTGIVHYSELANNDWWKQPNVSLILYPDGILDNYKPQKVHETAEEEFVEQFI